MTDLFDLTGKVALVTGASAGLGAQSARALAGNGADVAICARREEKLLQVKKEIEALGVRCYIHVCDVSKVEDINRTVADVEAYFGKIDILVNNAGITETEPAETQSDEDWNQMLAVNLSAPYFFARAVSHGMLERGYGKIINMGSMHSVVAALGTPVTAYASTKGGIEMLTKALAVEWASRGITVNAIGPAYFPSEMTAGTFADKKGLAEIEARFPMGRCGRDGELDGAILYFASDASSFTTGQLLIVDGGWTSV